MSKLDEITVKGYKSIKELVNFKLNNLNILIGANGAGKSNFLSCFEFIKTNTNPSLQISYVEINGGADALLYLGRKITPNLDIILSIDKKNYELHSSPTVNNGLSLDRFFDAKSIVSKWRMYHFGDTSKTARVKQVHAKNDNLLLKADAENLAPYLLRLKREYSDRYQAIVDVIKLIAPYFADFLFRDDQSEYIELEWFETSDLETPHKAYRLSDGTLRFICLATLLLQPFELMPDIILIDEPELGLHPYAIRILADLIKRVASVRQVIISTQSVDLINCFVPEDIIVVDRVNNQSVFKRLDPDKLKDWLDIYSLGDIWSRNIIGGGPYE